MTLTFLTPAAALVALLVVVAIAAALLVSRRAAGIRHSIRLPTPRLRSRAVPAVALVSAAALVGVAAAQPVLERSTHFRVRSDAEVYVVVDVSRSMLARSDRSSPARIARATSAAVEVREQLSGVKVGIASLTDRVLPHLFPSANEDVFRATIEQSIGIDRPPPGARLSANGTTLEALGAVATRRFFSPTVERRLLVVVTDGETRPLNEAAVAAGLAGPPAIETLFVHVWGPSERVFVQGIAAPDYKPDPTSRASLDRLARATGGAVYSEDEVGAAARKARQLIGSGPTVVQRDRRERKPLAPLAAAAAFLPLGLLLARRGR
ncbi:MAG: VWA domain-containing protein [Acidobacteriota bacterium]